MQEAAISNPCNLQIPFKIRDSINDAQLTGRKETYQLCRICVIQESVILDSPVNIEPLQVISYLAQVRAAQCAVYHTMIV